MRLPHYVQITDKTKYGDSKLFRIRLNPKYKDDKGLMLHEYTHVKQFYAGFCFGLVVALIVYLTSNRLDYTFYSLCVAPFYKGMAYTFLAPCRLFFEVDAFAKQISIEPQEQHEYLIKTYAKNIAEEYNLSVSAETVEKKLRLRVKSV
jgi:hypothetical protein